MQTLQKFDVPIRKQALSIDAYVRHGTGRPIVGLHAGCQDYTALQKILDPYSDRGRTIIIPNLSGHGGSDEFPFFNVTVDDYVAMLMGLMQQLRVGEYTAVGNSLGGIIAAATSKKDPNLKTLCMISSIDINPLRSLPYDFVKDVVDLSKSLYNRNEKPVDYTDLEKELKTRSLRLTHEDIRDLGLMTTPTKTVIDVLGIYPGYNARPITVPTLIIYGEKDELVPMHDVEEMAQSIPSAHELKIIPNAGHFVVNQHPERVIEALEELKSLEGK